MYLLYRRPRGGVATATGAGAEIGAGKSNQTLKTTEKTLEMEYDHSKEEELLEVLVPSALQKHDNLS